MRGYKKGQMTIVNLLSILITLIVYLTVFVPVLQPLIDDLVVTLQGSPNSFTPVMVIVLHSVPFFLLVSIVITAVQYATARMEGYPPQQGGY